jgi:hypothetical protein
LNYRCSHSFSNEAYSGIHLEIIKVSLIAVKQTWISKSIKVSLIVVNNIIVEKLSLKVSLIAVNVIDYHFHVLQ